MLRNEEALYQLCDAEGLNEGELMDMSNDSVNPGICLSCGATITQIEPDCVEGCCCECGQFAVISSTMLFLDIC